ncbi:CocE/NonD family hydrolase [Actinomadura flavalba]|uniref:CocE/NonD family hydrolase n=1 Tax=Actinomadura flavalba TaxID=1120938 RepID=UPI00035DE2B2|nr:CocE/NonD family hydrolase [Actinomadura flavalba]
MRRVLAVLVLLLSALGLAAPPPATAAPPEPGTYRVHVLRDQKIPLPDGRVLRADIHSPADPATGKPADGPFPVIVGFTPYGKTPSALAGPPGTGGLNPYLVERGYIGVIADVPGTGGSTGAFDLFSPEEATAGAALVRWAAALPRSTGNVGMLGLSYVAIDQLFTAAEIGPGSPLKAIFPMAASADPYRDLFTSGGALNVLSPLGLVFGYGVTRVATPFLELPGDPATALTLAYANLMQAGNFELVMARDMILNGPRRYDGPYWRTRAPETVLRKIVDNGVAVHLAGGLYDVFQRGEPLLYSGLQNAAAGRPWHAPMLPGQPADERFRLLTGPWTHGNIGEGVDLNEIQLQWFDRWLKGRPADLGAPLQIIEPGGRRYEATTYPLTEARPHTLYLRENGRLTPDAPAGAEPPDTVNYTGLSDPCTRSTDQFAAGLLSGLGIGAACVAPRVKPVRDDGQVTYATAPLERPLTLAGPIGVTLRASSTRPDALFSLTVEDVAPDGSSTDITGGAQLGSLRALDDEKSWPGRNGALLRPYHRMTQRSDVPVNKTVRYDIEVRPAFATVPAGHRLRLRVATADFPHLIPLADLPALFAGRYALRHSAAEPSSIELSVR